MDKIRSHEDMHRYFSNGFCLPIAIVHSCVMGRRAADSTKLVRSLVGELQI